MAAAAWLAIGGGGCERMELICTTPYGVFVDSAASLLTCYTLILAVLPPAMLETHGFRRDSCPFGAHSIIGSHLARTPGLNQLHPSPDPRICSGCRVCERGCPMGLPGTSMAERGDPVDNWCLLCGICDAHCPTEPSGTAWAGLHAGWVGSGRR